LVGNGRCGLSGHARTLQQVSRDVAFHSGLAAEICAEGRRFWCGGLIVLLSSGHLTAVMGSVGH